MQTTQQYKKLFDLQLTEKGGIFDTDMLDNEELKTELMGLKNDFRRIYDFIKFHYPKLPYVHFEFINNNYLNACAAKIENHHFVGLNLGSYYLFLDLYCKMLATSSILNEIGNIDVENEEIKVLNQQGYRLGVFQQTIIPRDNLRLEFATTCAIHAWRFLFFHELGHIVRGHTGLICNAGSKIYSELNYSYQPQPFPKSTLQTMEMDADSFAINNLIRYIFPEKPSLESKGKDLKYLGFTIFAMMRLLGFRVFEIDSDKRQSHPSPGIRMSLIVKNLGRIFYTYMQEEYEELLRLVLIGCREAEKAFSYLSIDNSAQMEFKFFFDPMNHVMKGYSDDIIRYWNVLRPLLQPFAFGELPPLNNFNGQNYSV